MIPVTARWLPYGLPLLRPWESSRGRLDGRRGHLLCLEAADGRIGWGDCAPLPEAGIDETQATRHAESCAALDLEAQAAGVPLAAWLAGCATAPDVPVNASLGAILSLTPSELREVCAAGYSVLKIKTGCAPLAAEIDRLTRLAAELPAGATLRLDANGAWNEATAATFLRECRQLPVESLEEPLATPDPVQLARLQDSTEIALALDESLSGQDMEGLLRQAPVRRLIVKPARHGGLRASLEIARKAQQAGIDCVVTSALESACGLLAAAHLAAAIGAVTGSTLAHGLATAGWFAADTGRAPVITAGRLALPRAAGLGFVPLLA